MEGRMRSEGSLVLRWQGMRLYPQPPVLIRRALEPDVIGGFPIPK